MTDSERVDSQPAEPRRVWRWRALAFDQLMIVVVLALIWAFVSVVPLPPNDLWWHMAAGREMIESGELLRTNQWAYGVAADAPYVYQSWLSEILLYGFWRLGGVPLLALARALAVVAGYGLIAWLAWRRTGNGRAVALALILAALVGWENWTLRPQTLALVPGAAFAFVLAEVVAGRLGPRWLWLLPGIMVAWVNLHGSFALGAVLLAMAWLAAGVRALRTPYVAGEPAWRAWKWLTICGAATALALLANPLGSGIGGYVQMMLGNQPLQRWFQEWQPPRNTLDLARTGFWFFTLLLLIAVLMAYAPRRPRLGDVLAYCALAWLGIGGIRYAMWFGLLLCPFLAELLAQRMAAPVDRPAPRGLAALCLGPLALLVVALLPWFVPRWRPSDVSSPSEPAAALLAFQTPIGAVDWLERNPIAGRLWSELDASSYVIWRLPGRHVMADQRVELFPAAVWEDFIAINEGGARTLPLLDDWQISYMLLDPQYQPKLTQLMGGAPGWCERYRDPRSVIVARCQ